MDDADRATILRVLPSLVQTVQCTPQLLHQLQRLRVLTPAFREQLEVEPVPSERCRQLLMEVPRRGPTAFAGLLQALLETGQLAAARQLRPDVSLADLTPAAVGDGMGDAPAQPPGPGVVPTTPAHPPLPPHPAPPAHALPPPPEDLADGATVPGPTLRLRTSDVPRGTAADSYRMTSRPRGLALVISNINFRDQDLHPNREGGERDEVALPSLLEQLGFRVQLERDLDRRQLQTAVSHFAKMEEHGQYDAAVLAVLTHGGQHVLYGVDHRPLPVEEVISSFSHEAAPLLAGKPKWLIFQACRGNEGNRALRMRTATDGKAFQMAPEDRMMAEFGDIYLTFSTIPGYVSMRDLDRGTWLVQVLCEVFAEHAHDTHLADLHVLVHERMDHIITGWNEKQTIETSQRGFRKKLYFNPGL